MNDTFAREQQSEQQTHGNTPHLRDYISIVTKRKMTVLTVLAITFLVTIIKTYSTTPYYTASSHVLIERNMSPATLDAGIYAYYDPDFMATQMELIRSANVALKVVNRLGLNSKKYRHYFFSTSNSSLLSPLSSIKKTIKGFIPGLSPGDSKKGAGNPPDKTPDLSTPDTSQADTRIIAARIQGGLSIRPVGNTKTVHITYSDPSPIIAKLIVDSIVQSYIDEILEIKLATSQYSQQWMTSKAEEERKKLAPIRKKQRSSHS
jgi:polysaccharide biosynthesis transport protein